MSRKRGLSRESSVKKKQGVRKRDVNGKSCLEEKRCVTDVSRERDARTRKFQQLSRLEQLAALEQLQCCKGTEGALEALDCFGSTGPQLICTALLRSSKLNQWNRICLAAVIAAVRGICWETEVLRRGCWKSNQKTQNPSHYAHGRAHSQAQVGWGVCSPKCCSFRLCSWVENATAVRDTVCFFLRWG